MLASIAKAILPWAAAAAVGALVWNYTPVIGPAAQVHRAEKAATSWRDSAIAWRGASNGWKASFGASEKLRGEENGTAQAAAASLISQCAARVSEARQSARVIERIIRTEPTYDENRCPTRQLVDPGLVRDAIAPAARPR